MRQRPILAILVAPLASGVLQALLMGNVGAFVGAVLFAYIFAAFIGLPALAVLRWRNKSSLAAHLAAGLIAGAACGLLFGLWAGSPSQQIGAMLLGLGLFALHGLAVALVYWLIARAGSPKPPQSGKSVANA